MAIPIRMGTTIQSTIVHDIKWGQMAIPIRMGTETKKRLDALAICQMAIPIRMGTETQLFFRDNAK